ncbi:MAG: RtcB family protein [Lentimicrobiaceae bacterium]|nr:RtcB family protein [Lentimicrobiaceae bacterium]
MKKIKIRAGELKRIGYTNSKAITLAIQLVSNHFSRSEKVEALECLEEINASPNDFVNDPVWGGLAEKLLEKNENKKKEIRNIDVPDFKIYGAENIDAETIQQMQMAMKLPISVQGALMPDAHLGYGLPIGGVLATYNAVIPYGVGMDIGCRMCLSVYPASPQKIETEREHIKDVLLKETRFGRAEFSDEQDHEILERKEFREIKFLKSLHKVFAAQLGTSGHGNHFVDIGYVDIPFYSPLIGLQPGAYFAVLSHSGSRNFGAQVCQHYTEIAKDTLQLTGEGARLAWLNLDSEAGQEYWAAMQLAGDYSHANHRIIHDRISAAFGLEPIAIVENHHNFAWKEVLDTGEELVIHRKGATPARIGDVGVIPGTMASPAYIVAGKGNQEALQSAAHGAGRLMSRNQARKVISEKKVNEYLREKNVELIGGDLDEAPFAYKDIHEVMESQKDLVEVLGKFHPRIVRMK